MEITQRITAVTEPLRPELPSFLRSEGHFAVTERIDLPYRLQWVIASSRCHDACSERISRQGNRDGRGSTLCPKIRRGIETGGPSAKLDCPSAFFPFPPDRR